MSLMNVTYCEFDWILGCRHGWPSLYCLSIRCVPRLWHLEAIGQWTIPASVILSLEQGEDASLLPPYTTWHSLEHSWVTESLMFLWVFQLHWLILAYTGFNSSMWIFWGRRREHTQLTRTCFPAAISRPWCLASGLWHTLRVIRMHCSHKHKNCIPRLYWNRKWPLGWTSAQWHSVQKHWILTSCWMGASNLTEARCCSLMYCTWYSV